MVERWPKTDLFSCIFWEWISSLSKFCAAPFALQTRALCEREKRARRRRAKGRKRVGRKGGKKERGRVRKNSETQHKLLSINSLESQLGCNQKFMLGEIYHRNSQRFQVEHGPCIIFGGSRKMAIRQRSPARIRATCFVLWTFVMPLHRLAFH